MMISHGIRVDNWYSSDLGHVSWLSRLGDLHWVDGDSRMGCRHSRAHKKKHALVSNHYRLSSTGVGDGDYANLKGGDNIIPQPPTSHLFSHHCWYRVLAVLIIADIVILDILSHSQLVSLGDPIIIHIRILPSIPIPPP